MADIERLRGISRREILGLRHAHVTTIEALWDRIGDGNDDAIKQLSGRSGIPQSRLRSLLTQYPDIKNLKGISPAEDRKFRDANIGKVEDVWRRVRQDPGHAVSHLSRDTGIAHHRITELLASQGATSRRVTRYVVPALMLLVLGALAALLLTIVSSTRPDGKTVIAARDLASGRVLKPGDLSSAHLQEREGYFTLQEMVPAAVAGAETAITTPTDLYGAILARNVPSGRPVRHSDVLRPQVIAAKDIAVGTSIAKDAVKLVWSPYESGAAVKTAEVIGHPLRQDVRKDHVVLSAYKDPIPTPEVARQVVVRPTAGLAPYQVIGPEDLRETVMPRETAAVTSVDAALGRYTLRSVPHGAPLHSGDISGVRVSEADLRGKRILSVPVRAGTISAGVVHGARVSLLLSPRANGLPYATPPAAARSFDAMVLSVVPQGAAASLVVAVDQDDLQTILPLLGTSEVFVSQRAP